MEWKQYASEEAEESHSRFALEPQATDGRTEKEEMSDSQAQFPLRRGGNQIPLSPRCLFLYPHIILLDALPSAILMRATI